MAPRPQRRGGKIAFTEAELNLFLRSERTCRVASVAADGTPHVTALWYVWDDRSIWLSSITRSQRWTDIIRNPNVSVLVDAGVDYMELRGAEVRGQAHPVGEIPRTGEPVEELVEVEQLFADKYSNGKVIPDGRHAWLKLVPEKIVSWDFRKIG